ncbi:hypothetical protein CBOM_04655 [Ceraceosorus bombacis]|uniref:Uncharacterized protein n=1 Tax=Ceraceosorus bombacis TaxID=401625 RepID=A0A0N7LB30_9BASI|nr:hypothetical protein CBOM_04655 [Ceraceosorus bombacis]
MHASSYLVAAVGFAAYAYAQGANGFTVATPNSLVQCQPVRLTWTGGVPPYFPRISQPGQVGQIIDQFPQTTETFFVWTVNQPVGQTVTIACFSILLNSLNGNGGNGGSASNSGSASPSGSTSSSSGSSSTATRPTSSSTGSSSTGTRPTNTTNSAPATSTTPAGTRPDSASSIRGYSAIVAGAVGVVAAALA